MSLKLAKIEKHLLSHRKGWFIGLGIGLVCVLGVLYIWGSVMAWESFEKGNLAWHDEMKERSKKVFSVTVKNQVEKAKKQQEFDDLMTTIQSKSDRCNFSPLFSWQQFIQVNKERMQKCQQLVSGVRTFGKSLSAVNDHLRSENNVAQIIRDAAQTNTEVDETKWPGVTKQWADAETKIQKLNVAGSFSATKDLAVSKAKSIQAAWNALIAANSAKDRAKYEEADAMLTQAYGTLDEITQSSEAKLLPLITKLEQAYSKAYKKP